MEVIISLQISKKGREIIKDVEIVNKEEDEIEVKL